MKKADALSCASRLLSWKMAFTAATRGSTSEVMKPHAKNRQVTIAYALVTVAERPSDCATLLSPDLARHWWQLRTSVTSGELPLAEPRVSQPLLTVEGVSV